MDNMLKIKKIEYNKIERVLFMLLLYGISFVYIVAQPIAKLPKPFDHIKTIQMSEKSFILVCQTFGKEYCKRYTNGVKPEKADTTGIYIYSFEPETGKLHLLSHWQSNRYFFSACFQEPFLYIAGGFNEKWEPVNDFHSFDIFKSEWKILPSMINARAMFAMGAYQNKIFAIAGNQNKANFEFFDVAKSEWNNFNPMISGEIANMPDTIWSYVMIDASIYMITPWADRFYEYLSTENKIIQHKALAISRQYFNLTPAYKNIYLSNGVEGTKPAYQCYIYNTINSGWDIAGKNSNTMIYSGCLYYNKSLFSLGGTTILPNPMLKSGDVISIFKPLK